MALALQQSDIKHFRKKKTVSGFRGSFSWRYDNNYEFEAMKKDAMHRKNHRHFKLLQVNAILPCLELRLTCGVLENLLIHFDARKITHTHTIIICFLALSLSIYLLCCWSFAHLLISIQFWWKQSCLFYDYKVSLCHYCLKT